MELGKNLVTQVGTNGGFFQRLTETLQLEVEPNDKLALNGKEIHSLAELREHFALRQVMDAFLDGSLEAWLKKCYYENEAEEVRGLKKENCSAVEQKLCHILSVDYAARGDLTPEQKEVFSRRCEILRRHNMTTETFAHVAETATTQMELAELLDLDCSVIYLCDGSFTVPIHKSGVHYIGIDHPRMEAPFTQEQYRRAGITFEGIDLPEKTDEKTELMARDAARKAGYDDFGETHNPLTTLLHDGIRSDRAIRFFRLKVSASDIGCEEYKSKFAAERAAKDMISQAYDEANAFFSPESRSCIAYWFAQWYAARIHAGVDSLHKKVTSLCKNKEQKERLEQIIQLTQQAEENLRKQFCQALQDSADYYRMYEKSYFLNRFTVEKIDGNADPFDSDFMNSLARIIHDESTYMVGDIYECIQELQNDVEDRVATFADLAYGFYQEYCEKMEALAEELGEDISKDDLVRLNLMEA